MTVRKLKKYAIVQVESDSEPSKIAHTVAQKLKETGGTAIRAAGKDAIYQALNALAIVSEQLIVKDSVLNGTNNYLKVDVDGSMQLSIVFVVWVQPNMISS